MRFAIVSGVWDRSVQKNESGARPAGESADAILNTIRVALVSWVWDRSVRKLESGARLAGESADIN